MTENILRLAMISDVHAYSRARIGPDADAPSFMEISNPSELPGRNPFIALRQLIAREGLSADVLLNCGDMGDKAQPDAIQYVWRQTVDLADELEATRIIATAGNHDVDSRGEYTSHDARGTLLGLPSFPFEDPNLTNEYWSRNVVVVETDDARWVVLNSAAYHGFKDEYRHGRIAASTLDYLKDRLSATANDKLNILVCHHHVYKIGNIDLTDYSEMTDGFALLSMLELGGYGSWIIFHGHRHWPSITYAPGGNNSPVVFAAGSLSAILWADIAGRARNQFYLVDLLVPTNAGRVRGTFRAWDFVADEGFSPAQSRSGLPHRGGFGGALSGSQLAEAIAGLVSRNGESFVPWAEVIRQVPDVLYTLPGDMRQCMESLKTSHGLHVAEVDGEPKQVGKY